MATYVSLVNYTDQGIRNVKDSPKRLDAAKKLLKDMGGELKAFYLTMGAYDIVIVAEAPSDEAVAKFSLAVASIGNVRTTTLKAFNEAEYRKIVAALP
ncbi:MAG: GYD domain-containing protein [Candidatus Rokubacteria bacterium]|nr:GYD domain-containing protein [Candidatus Rokubacteria bacterium]